MENITLFLGCLCLSSLLILMFIFILTLVIQEVISLKKILKEDKGE